MNDPQKARRRQIYHQSDDPDAYYGMAQAIQKKAQRGKWARFYVGFLCFFTLIFAFLVGLMFGFGLY